MARLPNTGGTGAKSGEDEPAANLTMQEQQLAQLRADLELIVQDLKMFDELAKHQQLSKRLFQCVDLLLARRREVEANIVEVSFACAAVRSCGLACA